MEPAATPLDTLVASSLDRAVPPEIVAMADTLRRSLGPGVIAILAYGSCLRGVAVSQSLIDLYVLVKSPSDVGSTRLAQWACRLVPPNVYYAEAPSDGATLRCKYAVLPLNQFARWMEPRTANPYFWARFAQPSALVYCTDANARASVTAALATALRTAYAHAKAIAGGAQPPLPLWQSLFENTYTTELRSERADRARDLVQANEDYFKATAKLLADEKPVEAVWWWRRLTGRLWSVARLVKAAFTFNGGADYLAWKIERHSGHKIVLSDWQRRHPLLASLTLLPKLIRAGAVR